MTRGTTRLGMSGYVPILRMFVDRPTTIAEVMDSGVGATAAKRIVRALHAMRLIHIADWQVATNQPPRAVYSFGNLHDAPITAVRPNGRPATPRPVGTPALPCDLVAFRTIISALQVPSSCMDVCQRTGMCWTPIDNALRALREYRLIRVAAWRVKPQGGPYVPLYQFAIDLEDEPRPVASRQARNARYRQRARQQALMDKHLKHLASNASVFAWRPTA